MGLPFFHSLLTKGRKTPSKAQKCEKKGPPSWPRSRHCPWKDHPSPAPRKPGLREPARAELKEKVRVEEGPGIAVITV